MQYFANQQIAIFLLAAISYSDFAFGQHSAILTGKLDSLPDGTVITLSSSMGYKAKTSVKNNTYQFVIPAAKQWDMYVIWHPNKKGALSLPVLLRSGSKMQIKVTKNFDQYTITGNNNADEQNDFWRGLNILSLEYSAVQKKITETKDSTELIQLKKKLGTFQTEFNKWEKDWIIAHKSSPFSCAVIRLFLDYTNVQHAVDTTAEKYFDTLTTSAKANNFQATLLQNEFASYNPKYSNNRVGDVIAKEIVVKDTLGNTISLNGFNDKYVLIDFWASWCSPCRANNPSLINLYSKFHDKGFEIFSISLDTDESKWKGAIVKDKMTWFQGSDLKGETSGVAADFQIVSIPHYILISPDKKIILNGDSIIETVENKLNQLLLADK